MPKIFVDADACSVNQEVCKVARRYGLAVTFVSNARMGTPDPGHIDAGFDAADDWIAGQVIFSGQKSDNR